MIRLAYCIAIVLACGLCPMHAAESQYQLVENWAQFPSGVAKWGAATGVDVDRQGNVYVLQRTRAGDRPACLVPARGPIVVPMAHIIRIQRCRIMVSFSTGRITLTIQKVHLLPTFQRGPVPNWDSLMIAAVTLFLLVNCLGWMPRNESGNI
jgi:hypothetical protein